MLKRLHLPLQQNLFQIAGDALDVADFSINVFLRDAEFFVERLVRDFEGGMLQSPQLVDVPLRFAHIQFFTLPAVRKEPGDKRDSRISEFGNNGTCRFSSWLT